MESTLLRYRGRNFGPQEIAFVKDLIAAHPGVCRRTLSFMLCEAWNWVQANGALRDRLARGVLLELHRAGFIELPPSQRPGYVPTARRSREAVLANYSFTPKAGSLLALRPLDIQEVRRTPSEDLFEGLIEKHHYLGYAQPVGEHLKYLVSACGEPMACLVWSSAPRHIGCRDRFIGWSKDLRRRNIHLIAINQRFLILPWVKVPHLATHILGQMTRRLARDWQRLYGHPIHFVETFVDTERFQGTCYRAANWVDLGLTTGRGKDDHTMRQNRSLKRVFCYSLTPDFREKLTTS